MIVISADNGIFILHTTDEKFRVVHAQAIDNIDYYKGKDKKKYEATLVSYFGDSKVYDNEEAALGKAGELYDEIMNDDYGICEYGIQKIKVSIPFPKMTRKQANKILDFN